MGKLTIKDIAKMANVSPTLVSFVINNKPGVSPETRQKILDIIEQTDFKPNINFRRLTTHKTFNICVVIQKTISPFNDFFYYEITQGFLEQSEMRGYNIILANAPASGTSTYVLDLIDRREIDGIIFYRNVSPAILEKVSQHKLPAVLVDIDNSSPEFIHINADYKQGAMIATQYLIDHGHREIALLSSSTEPKFNTQIFTGFCETMEANRLSAPLSWLQINSGSEELAYRSMEKILSFEKIPTAVICAADMFAISAIRCAQEKGYSVPDDISFIGIDDIIIAKYTQPALTTIKIDKQAMAQYTIDTLIRKINQEENVQNILVPINTLVERKTVKDINS